MGKSLNIIIVGAGLGGLGAAIALCRKGHSVTVLESAAELAEIGAGIQIPPNKKVFAPAKSNFMRWPTGDLLAVHEINPHMQDAYGSPYWLIHRADYQKILYSAAISLGVKVELATSVSSVDATGPTPNITLKDGRRLTSDLVIGADGIRSRIRASILQDRNIQAQDSPNCAYRGTVPASLMFSDPAASNLMNTGQNIWIGPDHGLPYSEWRTLQPRPLPSCKRSRGEVERARRREHYRDWDPLIVNVLSKISSCGKWKLASLPPLPTWISPSSRVLIIGDAAHGMLPYMAQGAAFSIEDGAALAECLSRASKIEDVPQLLKAFEDVRKPRCETISQRAVANGNIWHQPDGPGQEKRDANMRVQMEGRDSEKVGTEGEVDKWLGKNTQLWLFGYKEVSSFRSSPEILNASITNIKYLSR